MHFEKQHFSIKGIKKIKCTSINKKFARDLLRKAKTWNKQIQGVLEINQTLSHKQGKFFCGPDKYRNCRLS